MYNEYKTEQELTDKYGDAIIDAISNHIYTRCYLKEEQIKGDDYVFPRRVDLKFDFYDNANIIIEDYNSQWKEHNESWVFHGDESDIVVYVKMCASIAIIFTKKELREFTKTETYKKRISIKAKNSQTTFKNFRLPEVSDIRKRIVKLDINFDIIGKESKDFIYSNER